MFGNGKCVDSGAGELSLIHTFFEEKFTVDPAFLFREKISAT